jgi:superfamily II DNA or RNA helicase
MREHLEELGIVVRRFLSVHLPELGDDWWEKGVVTALSYQQRQIVQERRWTTLEELDLAALLRLVDQNWEHLRPRSNLSFEARNWLKEAMGVRNRDAHKAPNEAHDAKRHHRDLDTIARLAESLEAGAPETASLMQACDVALRALATPPTPPVPQTSPLTVDGDLSPGTLVQLRSRPDVRSPIMRIESGGKERSVVLFVDGKEQSFFESQVEPARTRSASDLTPEEMRAGLTATELLRPTSSHLYSFNSGRIDYEPYQFRPVMKLIAADRPRLLIADDVGVGKTIEAALIIKELQARQPLESVLVICPKQLVVERKWRNELRRFDLDFVELDSKTLRYCIDETRLEGKWPSRYAKAIVPYSLLDEKLLLGDAEAKSKRHGLVSLIPPVKFDLVLVDEAHHIRNKDTWSHRNVKHLLDSADAAVLISATPIQTGATDLFNLLQLLRPDVLIGPSEFERMAAPNAFLARAEEIARRGDNAWRRDAMAELEAALTTTWGRAVMTTDPRAQAARDLLEEEPTQETRVKAVRALQSLNTFSGLINRTRRRDIGAFAVRNPETVEVAFTPDQEAVHSELIDVCTRIVGTRNPSMPVEFLLSTLRRQASSCINGLAPFVGDLLESRLTDEELSEADFDGEWSGTGDLSDFRNEIQALAERASRLVDDPKLDALLGIIREKQLMENNKLLIFSTFRHTLSYLLPRLEGLGTRVGLVHGGVADDERREIRARFALDKTDPTAFDVLLSSEVGTEGLDNQYCDTLVNYDIPWNPMRIEQRIGRIDRRGQKSEAVSIKNMIVRDTVDATIYFRCLDRIGVFRQSLGGSEEILGELTREMRAIADDLSLTGDQLDSKLRQLADNKIARMEEQSALEDKEASLFGLSVQKIDDEGVAAAASPWLARPLLAGLVEKYLADSGYLQASEMFDRPVAVFRPNKEVRASLYAGAQALGMTGPVVARWLAWLDGSGAGARGITFDPARADRDDIDLLTATHPLVRAAAAHAGGLLASSAVALVASGSALPKGRLPFAVYGWTTLGVRDSHEVKVLTTVAGADDEVAQSLLEATAGESYLNDAEIEALDTRHYEAWVEARTIQIERTGVHVDAQLASLGLTHRARIKQLEDQIVAAGHENIRRMRESELRSAEADFERRTAELSSAVERCDVTSILLCRGVLEVI